MNHKFIPAIAAFLILGMLLSAIPLTFAQTYSIGPQLNVVTIPQDDQELKTGVMILGIDPSTPGTANYNLLATDLMAQYKLIITYDGNPLTWEIGTAGPTIACNILQKDKVQVVPDPKSGLGDQGAWESLMTTMVDVSNKFVCKARWKTPANMPGYYESVGVLDVYYNGPLPTAQTTINTVATGGVTGQSVGYFIADNIVVVEGFLAVGRSVIFGSDLQDVCTLGWVPSSIALPIEASTDYTAITLPDGSTVHYIWSDPMGGWVSCGTLALAQRLWLGINPATGQDPLAPTS